MSNTATKAAFRQYIAAFKQAFVFTAPGQLDSSVEALEKVEAFITGYKTMIELAAGPETIPNASFNTPYDVQHDWNCWLLLHRYSVSFNAYLHYTRVVPEKIDDPLPESMRYLEP